MQYTNGFHRHNIEPKGLKGSHCMVELIIQKLIKLQRKNLGQWQDRDSRTMGVRVTVVRILGC